MAELLRLLEENSAAEPFQGFRCWSTSEVGPIMHREAAAPSRAVLLATHQPPRIRRVTVTDAGKYGSEELVNQEEVLAAVLTGDQSLILPVIGASGSGKSHLVLWMRARLEDEHSPNRKIIYVPKGETSLARVIELILDGRTGGRFDELREGVRKATRDMSLSEAARRLRDELSLAAGKIDPGSAGAEGEPLRKHVRDNIAGLLDDPVYAARLVGEGGPLRRLVEEARAGGSEEPAELKSEDLGLQLTAVELDDLSAPARTFLSDLQGAPALHETAVAVLNEVRDQCLSRVFGIEPTQLVAVMRELREQLHDESPELELVLMIEDFTLLQGIQHDLLEAMMELPVREGRQVMCGMKTVMAVTDGFFTRVLAASDTFRTRIAAQGHVYSLDVPYGSGGGVDPETLVQFAGRYLNAVRVGVEGLEASAPAVPNACEHCAHGESCHDAFGTSGESSFGLYPFNGVALDRVVRSRQETFNPRDLLAAMARTLTVHAQEIADGRFPSRGWAREFEPREHGREPLLTLPLEVQQQVDSLPKAEQRSLLLTFWGGVPGDLRNLAPAVHEAFGIPMAPKAGVAAPRPEAPPPPPPEAEGPDDIEQAVLRWRDGGQLDAEMARILRRVFHDAITAAADPENELFSRQFVNEFFGRDEDIVIPNAPGGGRRRRGGFQVEFAPNNEHALLFRGVLLAQRHRTWSKAGHRALVEFLTRVDAEAERLRALLRERLPERESDHAGAVALLALAGLAAGQGKPSDQRGLLSAALSLDTVDSEAMPGRWRVLINQCEQRRGAARAYVLQGAHVARGTAVEPSAVDGQRFLPTLADLSANWQLPEISESAPQPVQMLRRILDERLASALDDAHSVLAAWHDEIARLVGDPATVGERVKAWKAALDEAQQAGFLVASERYSLDGNVAKLSPIAGYVRGVLTEWPKLELGRRVAGVAKAPWAQLEPWREQLRAVEATFRASVGKTETQQAPGGAVSPVDGFSEALDRLAEAARLGGGGDDG